MNARRARERRVRQAALKATRVFMHDPTLTPERLGEMYAAIPVALRDQIDAAAHETYRIGLLLGATPNLSPEDDRLVASLIEEMYRRFTIVGRACKHVIATIQPIFIELCFPVPMCITCLKEFDRELHGSIGDFQCDRCLKFIDPLKTPNGMFPITAGLDMMTIHAGVCKDCRTALLAGEGWPPDWVEGHIALVFNKAGVR